VKGKGSRQERESVIRFDEESSEANVWTASEVMYRKLKKLGFIPVEDRDRSATFRIPKKCVSIRKPRVLTKEQREALRKRGKALGNGVFSSDRQ
jgi:hypothetical protein